MLSLARHAFGLTLLVATPAAALAVPPEELEVLRHQLIGPGDVSVRAVYRTTRTDAAGELHVGYNGMTGAWYHVTQGHAGGRGDDGRRFWASVDDDGGLSDIRYSDDAPGSDFGVERYFPTLILLDLVLARPELIQSLEKGEGGNLVLIAPLPGGSRHTSDPIFGAMPVHDLCVEVDAQGRVVRTSLDPEKPGLPTFEYEYSPDSPPGFPVSMRSALSKFELASLEVTPAARDFDAESAIDLHEQSKSSVRNRLDEIAANRRK
ncbi:MAG: hypothetical protein KF912_07235 [Phycisphaeraceae bacterium]|nr:hypothetical protein [Phycisphaeraceae bacterium]MBX3367094.1 hypothetical protein [Phycisphaeraceae bacterium]QYK47557.1 MAG: hypothetical protein KF838_12285 [Phycisphaeraceae bacterium]